MYNFSEIYFTVILKLRLSPLLHGHVFE